MKTIKQLFLLAFFLVACSNATKTDPISTDPDYTNNQIKLHIFDFNNSYKNADPVFAEIWNYSESNVRFLNNYSIRIFDKTKKGWVEIAEKPVTRLPVGDFISNPLDGSSNILLISVFPHLLDLNRKHDLRIYVFGQMDEGGQNIEVASFIDITLTP